MSGRSVRSSRSSAGGPAHRPNRRALRLVLFGGLIAAALALASCQPHGAALQGRITDTDAGRIAGIQVRVYSSTTESLVATTHTDRDGDYSFMPATLADGTYRILFSENSWWQGATGWADATDVTVTAGSTRVVDATIDAAKGSVAGKVTDGTGPLAGVQVTARAWESDQSVAETVTGADGTYRFDALPIGTYRFRFAHSGYTTRYSANAATLADAPLITVGEGSTITGIGTTLIGESSISGIISNGSAPVAGGFVILTDVQNGSSETLAVTSADGRFTFGGLNAGAYGISWYDGSAEARAYYGWTGDGPQEMAVITVPSGGAVDLGTLVWGTSLYPPTAPRAVTATAGAALAVVNWQAPAGLGGKAITGYTVTSDPGAKTCTTTGATRCAISGLTAGTSYTFTVTATNAIGDGPASAPTAPVIPTATAQWQQLATSAFDGPSGRSLSAMAPLGDGRVVLYGGSVDTASVFGDTWAWKDDAWTELHPTTSPGPLAGAAMASLPGGDVVLFGGTPDPRNSPSGETWIFDGTNWNRLDLTTAPSPRSGAAMTTLSNGDVLLFGGLGANSAPLADTWIFDGLTWTELDPGTSPSARGVSAIAALPGGRAVLFGGTSNVTTVLDDTWVFDGSTWNEADPTTAPPGRIGAAMTALGDGRVVLFGGADTASSSFFDDTWTFDGTDWTEQNPSTVPPARYGPAAVTTSDGRALVFGGLDSASLSEGNGADAPAGTWVFDGTDWSRHGESELPPTMLGSMAVLGNDQILLFGGSDSPSYDTVYGTTWLFDGTTWKGLHPATSPPPRAAASMVTLADGSVLLYGGYSPAHGHFDDTWIFDGTNWTEQTLGAPPDLNLGSLAATPDGGAVYFGGIDPSTSDPSNSTWVWDGSMWSERTPSMSPEPRTGASMAVGPDGHVVLFGGLNTATGTLYDDTWVWDGSTWHDLSLSAGPGGRQAASMVTMADGTILLYGGTDADTTVSFGDAWRFDGTSWTQDLTPGVPPARAGASMVTGNDGSVVLVGGFDVAAGLPLDDVWILH